MLVITYQQKQSVTLEAFCFYGYKLCGRGKGVYLDIVNIWVIIFMSDLRTVKPKKTF